MAEDVTKGELYEQAQDLEIEGRSSMTKEELAEAVEAETKAGGGKKARFTTPRDIGHSVTE
jgi:hypothetical protein